MHSTSNQFRPATNANVIRLAVRVAERRLTVFVDTYSKAVHGEQ
ncbi:hypothetical protein ACI2TS_21625 [Ralstonia nicotianae]